MKVIQINTVCGQGSTGRIATDLANALNNKGHECFIAYGQGDTSYPLSFKVGGKLENHLHNVMSRLLGKQGYYTKRGTEKLISFIEKIKPDVVHLHNLHGNYLNLEILFNYLSYINIPVVWSLHDCWAFTGKCAHYTNVGCYKWQTHCKECPQIKKYPPSLFLDRSAQMFDDKRKWFLSVKNMVLVPVSNWLSNELKLSFLSPFQILPVYNWIDNSIFHPIQNDFKRKHGIEENDFVILGVSAGWSKEDSKLKDFLRLSKLIHKDMRIVLVGGSKEMNFLPHNIIHIPYVHDILEMAKIYSMADVYIHLSVEDTFGKVIAEALSCGTPAVVYNSTACPEIIGQGCGYVVGKRDINAVYEKIKEIKVNGKKKYSANCMRHVKENYDINKNIQKIIEIYKTLSKIC